MPAANIHCEDGGDESAFGSLTTAGFSSDPCSGFFWHLIKMGRIAQHNISEYISSPGEDSHCVSVAQSRAAPAYPPSNSASTVQGSHIVMHEMKEGPQMPTMIHMEKIRLRTRQDARQSMTLP